MKGFLKRYDLLDILIFFGLLFIGTDTWGFEVASMNIRLVQILYVIIFVYMFIKGKIYLIFSKSFLAFAVLFVISCIFSVSVTSSFEYLFWVIYNYFFVLVLFYSYIRYKGIDKFINLFRGTLKVIFVLCVISVILSQGFGYDIPIFVYQHYSGISRTALWFYEPSYLATFLTIYLAFSSYMYFKKEDKSYLLDVIMSIISMVITTSSTGFIAIGLVLVVCILLKFKNMANFKKIFKFLLISILTIAVCLGAVYKLFPNMANHFIGRLFDGDLTSASGSRISDYAIAINLFKKYFFFGTGPGAYGVAYGVSGLEATNITLELFATLGIFGAVAFLIFLFSPLLCFIENGKFKSKFSYYTGAFCFSLIFLFIILQANQNYMRLYLWYLPGIIFGSYYSEQKKFKNQIISDGIDLNYKYDGLKQE